MESIRKVNLCHTDKCCPIVEIFREEIHIGEKGNLVRLKRTQWNELVRKIRSGELEAD